MNPQERRGTAMNKSDAVEACLRLEALGVRSWVEHVTGGLVFANAFDKKFRGLSETLACNAEDIQEMRSSATVIPKSEVVKSIPLRSGFHRYFDFKSKILSEGFWVIGDISFSYLDAADQATKRSIALIKFISGPNETYVLAHCRLRNMEERTFKVSRMREVVDESTGEIIQDLLKWLAGRTIDVRVHDFDNQYP